ncbi:MAG: pseudouridine synthase, partial [Bacteroidales bacterium]|nr:pseudouridine synthase [Bacteroidales bacterium]
NRKNNSSSENKDYNDSKRPYNNNDRDSSIKRNNSERPYSDNRRNNSEKPYSNRKNNSSSENKDYNDSKRPYNSNRKDSDKKENNDRKNNYDRNDDKYRQDRGNGKYSRSAKGKKSSSSTQDDKYIRLNKYIADSGLCSRRQADVLIESGSVKVNDVVVDKVGTKILKTDKVQVGGETLRHERLKYLLLNKPKGYVTTMSDPEKRNTVLQLVHSACKERIYPVGRLDRNTTGLLLFTNDGDLANKLMHPRSNVEKVYHVELDKPLTKNDMLTIADGIELDDGFIVVDNIAYSSSDNKKEIGVQIHSGKNRVVRRIFEKLGYEVLKLDRTLYAGLNKKDLPRGKWRFLTDKEVSFLKMI